MNNGGPAFPTQDQNYEQKYAGEGMTLRDYFAAKAMQGMFAVDMPCPANKRAEVAYEMADAMLKEREK